MSYDSGTQFGTFFPFLSFIPTCLYPFQQASCKSFLNSPNIFLFLSVCLDGLVFASLSPGAGLLSSSSSLFLYFCLLKKSALFSFSPFFILSRFIYIFFYTRHCFKSVIYV